MSQLIETKKSLLRLIKEAEAQFSGTGKALLDIEDYVSEYLTANGVIVPPCKVGQTVWFIRSEKIIETKVDKIVLKYGGLYLLLSCNSIYETTCRSIGKTVFLTREDAEKALAERSKE